MQIINSPVRAHIHRPSRQLFQRNTQHSDSSDRFQVSEQASLNPPMDKADKAFVDRLEGRMAQLETEACRQWFLFYTAKFLERYDSRQVYSRYPELADPKTLQRMQALYNAYPENEPVKRIFYKTLNRYIKGKLSPEIDALADTQNRIRMDVSDLGLKNKQDEALQQLRYEDIEYWLTNTPSDTLRAQLLDRWKQPYLQHVREKQANIFEQKKAIIAGLGYANPIDFFNRFTGHPLSRLADIATSLIAQTQDLYQARMAPNFMRLTGKSFSEARRSDIWYVLNGPDPELTEIRPLFRQENLIPLAEKTLDAMGLSFSTLARKVDYASLMDYDRNIADLQDNTPHILLDIAKREGKMARPYMVAARVPSEIYLSVSPKGGPEDYKAFFHEAGHACHFAYEDPEKRFSENCLGNQAATETYAFLFQNLILNAYWLQHEAGLTSEQANKVIRKLALKDLYGLRRYAAKLQFEVGLYTQDARQKTDISAQGQDYARFLTQATGFRYDPDVWLRDLDEDFFYSADYFTAWTLAAQLEDYLKRIYGTPAFAGEDWYRNPAAGSFLKTLWRLGRANPIEIAKTIGSSDPNDPEALLRNIQERFTSQKPSSGCLNSLVNLFRFSLFRRKHFR